MPKELFKFWYDAASGFGKTYESAVERAWQAKASKKKTKGVEDEWQRRNGLYEALGSAFQAGDYRPKIVSAIKYFIRIENKTALPGSFGLTCLFLERLAGMRKNRIEAIREIADQVSKSRENKKLLRRLFESSKNFMDWLVFAQNAIKKAGENPIRFDSILTALDMISEDDAMPRDFWLVRNLIILRALEVDPNVSDDLPEPVLDSSATDVKEN
jgi:CRISPR-associated protein Cst1